MKSSSYQKKYAIAKELTPAIFDEIAEKYDKLNRRLSFGFDKLWRNKFVNYLNNKKYNCIIDIASGTGDLLKELKTLNSNRLIALDPSYKMLEIAKTKVSDAEFLIGRAENIPLENNLADLITVSFGIRNFGNINLAFKEFYRILKPMGKLAIMEFSVPDSALIKIGYKLYVKYFIPIIGYLHTGNYKAYKYLSDSIFEFASTTNVKKIMADNDLTNIKEKKFIFGGVRVYCGEKRT